MPVPMFALYVSSVPGRPVRRYGSTGGALIGAARQDAANPGAVTYYPERVVGLSVAEVQRYGREYRRALSDGDLAERTEADYLDQE
jgi:hypothetical protein